MTDAIEGPLKLLLIEDDVRFRELTARYLESHGAVVSSASSGAEGELELMRRQYDCVLLDLMLPDRDGLEVCRRLRQRIDVPIIMLTARGEEPDLVLGLESGADDYVIKPVSGRTLLARIRAVVRRARGRAGPSRQRMHVGPLTIDSVTMTVSRDGKTIDLTAFEFAILRTLALQPGHVMSREQLLDQIKGSAALAFDRAIDAHVSRLRVKLGDDARRPRLLKTVRGTGYVLVDESEDDAT